MLNKTIFDKNKLIFLLNKQLIKNVQGIETQGHGLASLHHYCDHDLRIVQHPSRDLENVVHPPTQHLHDLLNR